MRQLGPWLGLLIAVAGCTRYEYVLDMEPDGPSVKRAVRVNIKDRDSLVKNEGRKDAAFPLTVKELAKVYSAEVPARKNGVVSFSGRFIARLPNDVGGWGRFVRWQSNLGSCVAYVERFRGDNDAYGAFQTSSKAVDVLVDMFIEILEGEAKQNPGWSEFRSFLDGGFRSDLHNVSLLSASLSSIARDSMMGEQQQRSVIEIVVRAVGYLAEQGYFDEQDIPRILQLVQTHPGEADSVLNIFLDAIDRRGRRSSPNFRLRSVASLQNWTAFQERFERHLLQSRYFLDNRNRVRAEIVEEGGPQNPRGDRQIGERIIGDLVFAAFAPWLRGLFSEHDTVGVSLKSPQPPVWTNGVWSGERKCIEWGLDLPTQKQHEQSPGHCYAIWAEPDAAVQTRVFRKTVLDQRNLCEYCVWYVGLSTDERRQWDAFIDRLTGTRDAERELKAFRFARERNVKPSAQDRIASSAAALIMKGLK